MHQHMHGHCMYGWCAIVHTVYSVYVNARARETTWLTPWPIRGMQELAGPVYVGVHVQCACASVCVTVCSKMAV